MNIEKERNDFNRWHFEHWRKNCAYSENIEDAKMLYDRVYSHAHSAGQRELGFIAWLASANRQGYRLVPVDPNFETMQEMNVALIENSGETPKYRMQQVYKAMIGACDD